MRSLTDRLVAALRWQLDNPGAVPEEGPEIPPAGRRVWSIFVALSGQRGSNGWGPYPIRFSEIKAWSRVMREPVRPFEVDIIIALDRAILEHGAERQPQGEGAPRPAASTRRMSPELFDALF